MLEHFQDNLNTNIANTQALANFMRVATTVRANLRQKYSSDGTGGFSDPANDDPYAEKEFDWATATIDHHT